MSLSCPGWGDAEGTTKEYLGWVWGLLPTPDFPQPACAVA